MPGESENLALSFIPSVLQEQYASDPDRLLGAALGSDHATLLWIDIFAFSKMCNRLMRDTANDVELLAGILQKHYDFILNTIRKHGGQPLFFAGDGLMSAWPGDKSSMDATVVRAASCAHEILRDRVAVDDLGGLLSLHVIIATGPFSMSEFEGVGGKILFSFAGEVFDQLVRSSRNKAVDQVLISGEAMRHLDKTLSSTAVEHDTYILHDIPKLAETKDHVRTVLSPGAVTRLKSYVPGTLSFPLDREKLRWIAEIRPVTSVFVQMPNDSGDARANLARMKECVALVAPIVKRYNGHIIQVWLDEKESNMFMCFGPPPTSHADNPERGTRLAMEMHELLESSGHPNSIGVATGRAFCGILGNDILRQYTVIGDVVNLSARLAGISRHTVRVDRATFATSNRTIEYGEPQMVSVKGIPEPIDVHKPLRMRTEASGHIAQKPVSVGRDQELSRLEEALTRAESKNGSTIFIEGESGMGKSRLMADFAERSANRPLLFLATSGDFMTRHTPYAVLRQAVADLLGIGQLDALRDPGPLQKELEARFGSKACLLNAVLNLAIPDSEEVRYLTGSQRVQATQDFLLNLILEATKDRTLLFLIDDAQWSDDTSWKLLASLRAAKADSLLVLSLQKARREDEIEMFKESASDTIVLRELSEQDLGALIRSRLGVHEVAVAVTGLIQRVSKGNPFFCNELIGSLQDEGLLLIQDGVCSLPIGSKSSELSLPETVRGAIRNRIDRLGPGSQLSLKVGSVVGNRFASSIISGIYPIASERESVSRYLHEVEQFGFLNEAQVDNMNGYHFNNATTVEVALEMTLSEQRKQLHRESAMWYETRFADHLAPFNLRLAHHWSEAGEKEKAAGYYERESIRLFTLGFAMEALNTGIEGVAQLGLQLPRDKEGIVQQIGENFGAIMGFMQGRTIESLVDHHRLMDPAQEKLIHLLLTLGPSAHQCQQSELFALLGITSQRITLEKGQGEAAAEVYAMFSIIYKALTHDAAGAFAWASLAMDVDTKNGYTRRSRVVFMYCWFIALWKRPMTELIPLSRNGADAGMSSGDILYACFNLSLTVILQAVCGRPLAEVRNSATENFVRNNQAVINAAFHLRHEEQVAKAFQGMTDGPTSLTDAKYDETRDIASICNTDLYNQIAYYFISKLKLNVHYGHWAEALAWAERSLPLLPAFDSQPGHVELEQYHGLAALYLSAASEGGQASLLRVAGDGCVDRMKGYAALCPENFLHKALLLEAVRDGLDGHAEKAEQGFIQAANEAARQGYVQDEGLACEHLLRMGQRNGKAYPGAAERSQAAYTAWGAAAKVAYIARTFA